MTTFKNFLILIIVSAAVMLIGCDDNSLGKLRELELDRLDKYIKDNNITVKPTASGLYYMEVQKGTGDTIKAGDIVDIYYRTWLIDSTLVDANISNAGHYYDPLRFAVTPAGTSSSVIDGLNEGVKFMQPGGVARLIVPSQIAYGQNGYGSIGAFSTLLFEVRIHKVIKGSN
jgi:FKBP-type peptidyl-prolyl cis-trans isomerase FkpA